MEQQHQDYIDYYRSRMRKYENNPLYAHSYQAEKKIYEAISQCASLAEFRTAMEGENLALQNAVALTLDKETARHQLFTDTEEFVRRQAPERILKMLETVQSVGELTTQANEIGAQVALQIAIDQLTNYFYSDFVALENIDVWQNAEIPPEWHQEIRQEWATSSMAQGRQLWQTVVVPESQKWSPHWQFDFNLVAQPRHRRLIPVPDAVVEKRLHEFKNYRGI
ncbi:MAG: hypothetical protein WCQ95_02290 [Bacteroidota bacterium]